MKLFPLLSHLYEVCTHVKSIPLVKLPLSTGRDASRSSMDLSVNRKVLVMLSRRLNKRSSSLPGINKWLIKDAFRAVTAYHVTLTKLFASYITKQVITFHKRTTVLEGAVPKLPVLPKSNPILWLDTNKCHSRHNNTDIVQLQTPRCRAVFKSCTVL